MNWELITFLGYFVILMGVALIFYFNGANKDQEDFFLGGREMGPWVTALSAQASDMSAWLLMGLPGSILAFGFGQMWIGIGLALGTAANWIFCAKRLRTFSLAAGDAITLPQYLSNRFATSSKTLQVICAVIFLVCYTIYVASAYVAGTSVFEMLFPGVSAKVTMTIFALVIVFYTFFGGFKAVCWTDFFQGLLMLAALLIAPIIALFAMNAAGFVTPEDVLPSNYYSFLSSGAFDKASIITIISGLGWGLGYMGMPHILVRYISIKSEKEMKKSRIIGSTWTIIIVAMASVVGIVARRYFGADPTLMADSSQAFISMVRAIFPALIAGILLSAILAASMSTADSQLLASSSAFASDVYKPMFRKNASDKEMLWAGRIVVIIISVVAFIIANSPSCSSIMDLVSNAWGAFGSAFGPVILLSLYWKRLNYQGALAGIVAGFAVDMVWFKFFASSTGLYEIVPGFFAGLLVTVLVSLITKAPSEEVVKTFEEGKLRTEE